MSSQVPPPLSPVAAHGAASAEGASLHTTLYDGRKAPHQLHVLVVGCGMGGLAAAHCLGKAGHKVTLFEAAPAIGEVGAGIQVTPNVSRLLQRWGAGPALEAVAVRPDAIALRRYDTGERVGYTQWTNMEAKYGAPYYHIHRADLHKLLFDLAAPHMTLRLNANVVSVDPDAPSVTLASGEVVRGDLIVGADGVKSLIQEVVLGHANPAEATGDAAYRAIIPSHVLLEDPELKELINVPEMTGWMGPGRHIMAYNIVRSLLLPFMCVFVELWRRGARRSTTLFSFTPTTVPLSRGQRRAAQIRCGPTSPITSPGTLGSFNHTHARCLNRRLIEFARSWASSSRRSNGDSWIASH